MRYYAKDLQTIYRILETYPGPVAVLDFFCGEVGCEIRAAQSLGGQFYDQYRDTIRVVALCWQGASLLYTNLSDDQIEFTDKKRSRSGNKRHDGGRKIRWLNQMGHGDHIKRIKNVVAYQAPQDVAEKVVERMHGLGSDKQWVLGQERLTRTGFVFSVGGKRLIQNPYIALFDRNEKHQPERNTRRWQINLFHKWAREFGLRLAIISDFYPRSQPDNVIRFTFNRDFDLLCNITQHSILYAAPASGAGDAGMTFGCNFVGLCAWSRRTKDIMPSVVRGRGFQHFGILAAPDGMVANKVKEYLGETVKK